MSTQIPRGPRRRIAGERRAFRSGPAGGAAPAGQPEPTDVTERMGPTDLTKPGTPTDAAPLGPPTGATGATGATLGTAPGTPTGRTGRRPRTPTVPVLTVLGVLALALVLTAAWLGLRTWDYRQVQQADRVQDASRTAPAVAERAAASVLSYSYKSLDADERAAERYLTPSFRRQYVRSMTLVRPNAPRLRATVVADVKASGVSHADADRVNVLVYVNQTTTSTANGGSPQVALNRAMFSMVRRGGAWLVDDITSY